ncbi:streptophobe family protein [Streptomyces sp. R08]|uniref:Streptophobe family protein n=1 Tax=Streptomyces sp. R08 TaxID=3238624 RepID=A0AB39M3T8_9ACTN
MSSATSVGTAHYDTRVPWTDVLLSAIAAVSWALIGMAGTAALGLHLLGADATGSLGPMTAAVVALGAGGSVTPTGDVSAFGLTGAQANTAVTITPLGVSLVGALLLSYFFLRSLRAAGVVIAPAELLARAGSVIALFVAMLGGLAWAGHDVITIDGSKLGLDKLTGGGSGGGVNIPGLGDIGDIGGLLPDKVGDLVKAKAAVGFTVDTAPTLLGGLAWSAGILLIALLASRRTPLPHGWEAVHRVVRPAASALVTVLLVAVAAGLAAAAYAAIGDDHPKRIAGAALLGAPNGVWLGIPLGLFVPWDGEATGELSKLLPHPLDQLLSAKSNQPVTVGRLAELDARVWLLAVAAALMMLLAGVLAAARTPLGVKGVAGPGGSSGAGAPGVAGAHVDASRAGGRNGRESALGFAGRCALRLGVVTALTLPLLAWLTDVSVDASLSVLGFDAFGAGIELHGHLGMALVLGAVWGAGAGGVGGGLAYATGAAGWRASRLARGELGTGSGTGVGEGVGAGVGGGGWGGGRVGVGAGSDGWGPGSGVGSGSGAGSDGWGSGYPERSQPVGSAGHGGGGGPARGAGSAEGSGSVEGSGTAGDSGPYVPSAPYRAPNPATNPYLQVPDELRQPEDRRPSGGAWPDGKQSGRGGGRGLRGPGLVVRGGAVRGGVSGLAGVGLVVRGLAGGGRWVGAWWCGGVAGRGSVGRGLVVRKPVVRGLVVECPVGSGPVGSGPAVERLAETALAVVIGPVGRLGRRVPDRLRRSCGRRVRGRRRRGVGRLAEVRGAAVPGSLRAT